MIDFKMRKLFPLMAVLIIIPLAAGLASCQSTSPTSSQPTSTAPTTSPTSPVTTPTTSQPPTTSSQPPTTQPTTTAPTTTVQPNPGLPLVNFSSADFAGSGACAVCHTRLTDEAGKDVSIDTQWRSTMMANAARDPYFRAKMSLEIEKASHLSDTIQDVCGTCHTPMARTQATVNDSSTLLFVDGFFNPSNGLHDAGIDGVSCTLCHQIQAEGLGQEDTFAGKYPIDTSTSPPNREIFSPFANPATDIMMSVSGFKPVEGPQMEQSALCASCHTVITPYLDKDGNVSGTFPEQVPFLEWSHSSVSNDKVCQDCHMPPATGDVATASMPSNLQGKSPFGQHYFVGGNNVMLKILRDNPEDIGVTASTQNFNDTMQRALDQLHDLAATVSIQNQALDGNSLSVDVNVANQAGHKLPTGFPSRRVWLHVTVTDKDGNVVFESGKPNPDGSIEGNDADREIYAYEPHYDTITSSDQVQIYESILQTIEGGITHTLLRAASYAKDNRILPQGFDKSTAGTDIAVYGEAAADDDFTGGSDVVTYAVDTSGHTGPFNVKVELLYQPLAFSTISSILEGNTAEIDQFEAFLAGVDMQPVVISSVDGTVS